MWPFKRRNLDAVRVRFIDAGDGTVLAEHELPLDRLPADFRAGETVMHVGDDDWTVVEADPPTVEAYRAARRLTLRVVRRVPQMVDPAEVLFSLPTVSASPPAVESRIVTPGSKILAMHEDDWRQLEWISATHTRTIDAEIAAIRQIYAIDQVGIGFRRCHGRQSIARPLHAASIEFDLFHHTLPRDVTWLDGVGIPGVGIVQNGFAARLPSSIEIYGTVTTDGFLECLGFAPTLTHGVPTGSDVQTLLMLATRYDLVLVDWPRARILRPHEPGYRALFHADD